MVQGGSLPEALLSQGGEDASNKTSSLSRSSCLCCCRAAVVPRVAWQVLGAGGLLDAVRGFVLNDSVGALLPRPAGPPLPRPAPSPPFFGVWHTCPNQQKPNAAKNVCLALFCFAYAALRRIYSWPALFPVNRTNASNVSLNKEVRAVLCCTCAARTCSC